MLSKAPVAFGSTRKRVPAPDMRLSEQVGTTPVQAGPLGVTVCTSGARSSGTVTKRAVSAQSHSTEDVVHEESMSPIATARPAAKVPRVIAGGIPGSSCATDSRASTRVVFERERVFRIER